MTVTWDDPVITWDDPSVGWDGYDVSASRTTAALSYYYTQVLTDPDSYSDQDVYHATVRTHHRVGSWLQILDEDEQVMWELPDVTDGGV